VAETWPHPAPAGTDCHVIVLPRGGSWSAGASSQFCTGWVVASGAVHVITAAPVRTLTVRPTGVPGPRPFEHGVDVDGNVVTAALGTGAGLAGVGNDAKGTFVGAGAFARTGTLPPELRTVELFISGDACAAGSTAASDTGTPSPQEASPATSSPSRQTRSAGRRGALDSHWDCRMPFASVTVARI